VWPWQTDGKKKAESRLAVHRQNLLNLMIKWSGKSHLYRQFCVTRYTESWLNCVGIVKIVMYIRNIATVHGNWNSRGRGVPPCKDATQSIMSSNDVSRVRDVGRCPSMGYERLAGWSAVQRCNGPVPDHGGPRVRDIKVGTGSRGHRLNSLGRVGSGQVTD